MISVYRQLQIQRSVSPSLRYTQMWLGTQHELVNIASENYIQSILMLWMMYAGPNYYCPNLEATPFKPVKSDTYARIMKPWNFCLQISWDINKILHLAKKILRILQTVHREVRLGLKRRQINGACFQNTARLCKAENLHQLIILGWGEVAFSAGCYTTLTINALLTTSENLCTKCFCQVEEHARDNDSQYGQYNDISLILGDIS